MITFYPRDIGMWREHFWFDDGSVRGIILAPPPRPREATFHDKNEFFDFLTQHGVRMDDPRYPLQFLDAIHYRKGSQTVVQFTCIGWVDWV